MVVVQPCHIFLCRRPHRVAQEGRLYQDLWRHPRVRRPVFRILRVCHVDGEVL